MGEPIRMGALTCFLHVWVFLCLGLVASGAISSDPCTESVFSSRYHAVGLSPGVQRHVVMISVAAFTRLAFKGRELCQVIGPALSEICILVGLRRCSDTGLHCDA